MIRATVLGLMAAAALSAVGGWCYSGPVAYAATDTGGTAEETNKAVADPCCAPTKAGAADALSRATRMPAGAEKGETATAIACSLTDAGKRQRSDEIRALLTKAATRIERSRGAVQVEFSDGHAAEVVSFIELERACCPFLGFSLEFPSGKPMTLRVSAPEGGEAVLDALFVTEESGSEKAEKGPRS